VASPVTDQFWIPKIARAYPPILTGLFTLAVIAGGIAEPSSLYLLIVLPWFWWNVLCCPFAAWFDNSGNLILRRLIGTVELDVARIRSIHPVPFFGALDLFKSAVIDHADRKVWLRFGFHSSYRFYDRLHQMNPSVVIDV